MPGCFGGIPLWQTKTIQRRFHMKKFSLCIGAFLVLFLIIGVYKAEAQADLTAFDGLWMKDSTKFRKVVLAGAAGSTTVPGWGFNEAYKGYTCMEVDPTNAGTINLYSYDNYGNYVGIYGYLDWHSGTNSEFLGLLYLYSDDGFEYDFAYVTVIYGKFTAIPGYGTYSEGDRFDTWDFLWSGKIPKRVPSDIYAVACGWSGATRVSSSAQKNPPAHRGYPQARSTVVLP